MIRQFLPIYPEMHPILSEKKNGFCFRFFIKRVCITGYYKFKLILTAIQPLETPHKFILGIVFAILCK